MGQLHQVSKAAMYADMQQIRSDEKVIELATERMSDLGHVIAAIYRLGGRSDYVEKVAALSMARRLNQKAEVERLVCEINWLVEDEVIAQCRREVQP